MKNKLIPFLIFVLAFFVIIASVSTVDAGRNRSRKKEKPKSTRIPSNAHPHHFWKGSWVCDYGYERNHKATGCVKIRLPFNSHFNSKGRGFICDSGYEKNDSQDRCKKIRIPSHAHLNSRDNGWECDKGYEYNTYHTGCQKER